ncbi:MAG: nitroreductase [Desulfobacterium sp.]|nr:nitroreductase [Desulfobacterium sp.]MBU3949244.1 nitroreductase family protein [Pseudomonadota bacterium]MBU4011144.1 nitroreductase family protein [Pseudomonadota bacterium]MBU4034810.1 nitroreductase family protein [Pseudomonadota bacterium]
MSDIMEVIKARRSIRTYEGKDVPEEKLNAIFEAARWSPSWANTQCWELVVIRDKTIKENMRETLLPKNPAANAITQAPVLLAVCGKLKSSGFYNGVAPTKFADWFMFDLGIFTQTLCLAAHELGLGTVVVGLLDHDKANNVINVPDGYELVVLIPLGYPAKSSSAPKRRESIEFVHYNAF